MRKILAVGSHAGGMNAIIPVIKLLQGQGHDVTIIGESYACGPLKFNNMPFQTPAELGFGSPEEYGLIDMHNNLGILLGRVKPDLVLTGTRSQTPRYRITLEQELVPAAKYLNIPTLAVLDMWADYKSRVSDLFGSRGDFCFMPDWMAIMDEGARSEMEAEGFDLERLVVTGNPHFDTLTDKKKQFDESKRKELRERLCPGADKVLFYCGNSWESQGLGYTDTKNLEIISSAVKTAYAEGYDGKVRVAIKLHPRMENEAPKDYADALGCIESENDIMKLVGVEESSHELALMSDITAVAWSTMAMEAAYMGLPVISMQPEANTNRLYYSGAVKEGYIARGTTQDRCRALVQKAITRSEFRNSLIRGAVKATTDGRSAERVAQLAVSMIILF